MKGKLQVIEGVYPVTRAEGVYFSDNTTLDEKITSIGSNYIGSIYIITKSEWNLTEGDFSKTDTIGSFVGNDGTTHTNIKSYTNNQHIVAKTNLDGIQRALEFAKNKGYSYVKLEEGYYCLSYNHPLSALYDNTKKERISIPDGITLDLSGCTLRVIYDSWRYGGKYGYTTFSSLIEIKTKDTHVFGGRIIGDRYDRSWFVGLPNPTQAPESFGESTYGVQFKVGSFGCSIRNVDISDFMGDNITIGASGGTWLFGANPDSTTQNFEFEIGYYGYSSGSWGFKFDNNRFRTKYIAIPSGTKEFTMIGTGYAHMTGLNSRFRYYSVSMFDANQNHLMTVDRVDFPRACKLHKDTNFIILSFFFLNDSMIESNPSYNSAQPKSLENNPLRLVFGTTGFSFLQFILIRERIPEQILISDCRIHDGHRGNISLAGNDVYIINNKFFGGGMPNLDTGAPNFNYDQTRYAINQEDSPGVNTQIIGNHFEYTNIAVAIRGVRSVIENNHFTNVKTGVMIYSMEEISIKENRFDGDMSTAIATFGYSEGTLRHIIVDGNFFNKTIVTTTGEDKIRNLSNNTFVDSIINGSFSKMSGNTFLYNENFLTNKRDSSTIINSYFITIKSDVVENCVFSGTFGKNVVFMPNALVLNTRHIRNCEFALPVGIISFDNYETPVTIEGSLFKEYIDFRLQNQPNILTKSTITFKNCKFLIDEVTNYTATRVPKSPINVLGTDSVATLKLLTLEMFDVAINMKLPSTLPSLIRVERSILAVKLEDFKLNTNVTINGLLEGTNAAGFPTTSFKGNNLNLNINNVTTIPMKIGTFNISVPTTITYNEDNITTLT